MYTYYYSLFHFANFVLDFEVYMDGLIIINESMLDLKIMNIKIQVFIYCRFILCMCK